MKKIFFSLAGAVILFISTISFVSAMGTYEDMESRCDQDDNCIECDYETKAEFYMWGLMPVWRQVHYQVPLGTPPAGGWPVVILYQGSLFSGEISFYGSKLLPFGAYYQAEVVKTLLDNGYAVLSPEAHMDGKTFWDTNIPPYATSEILWETSSDHHFILSILDSLEDGDYGPVNMNRLYASGISSGGYMTSRMAVSYKGRFKALAIQSAAYATCTNLLSFETVICNPPEYIPEHPPTLFLHGSQDLIVPICTMESYEENLHAQGVPTRKVIDSRAGHEWIEAAPEEVLNWFEMYK